MRPLLLLVATLAIIKPVVQGQEVVLNVTGIRQPWINEFHYENFGTDVNEFIEVAAPSSLDISTYRVVLYNGFYGFMYREMAMQPLTTFTRGETVNGVTFYTKFLPPANCSSQSEWCGLQNGRDGIALANFFTNTTGRVVEFLSYEGSFKAQDGPAANLTSTNIGVFERTTTPKGDSLSRDGIGCEPEFFGWASPAHSSPGTVNINQTITCQVAFINEFAYDNVEGGVGQFIEVATNDVANIASYSIVLYNGDDGLPYDAILLSSFTQGDTTDGLTFYYYDFPVAGPGLEVNTEIVATNGTVIPMAAGLALTRNDEVVVDFISYGGSFTATGGVAVDLTSVDVGVEETEETPVGSSLQLTGVGCAAQNFGWTVVEESAVDVADGGETRGSVNVNQEIVCEEVVPTAAPTTLEDTIDEYLLEDDDFLGNTSDVQTMTSVDRKQFDTVFTREAGEPEPLPQD